MIKIAHCIIAASLRGRPKRGYRASLGKLFATGRTKGAAREAVTKLAAEALSGDKAPVFVHDSGWYGVVYHDGADWRTGVWETYRKGRICDVDRMCATLGYESKESAVRLMLLHLAMCAHDTATDGPPIYLDDANARKFLRNGAFQRAYRRAIDLGATDCEAHRIACEES